jgi:hypothetical protein
MKNKIPDFLQEKINSSGMPRTHSFPQYIKEFMIQYSTFYSWGFGNNLRKYLKL